MLVQKRKKRKGAEKRIKRNISELFLCQRRGVKKQSDAAHENRETRRCDVAKDKCLKAVSSSSTPEQSQSFLFYILYRKAHADIYIFVRIF